MSEQYCHLHPLFWGCQRNTWLFTSPSPPARPYLDQGANNHWRKHQPGENWGQEFDCHPAAPPAAAGSAPARDRDLPSPVHRNYTTFSRSFFDPGEARKGRRFHTTPGTERPQPARRTPRWPGLDRQCSQSWERRQSGSPQGAYANQRWEPCPSSGAMARGFLRRSAVGDPLSQADPNSQPLGVAPTL